MRRGTSRCDPFGVARRKRSLTRPRTQQIVVQLELLDPGVAQVVVAFRIVRRRGEKLRLLTNRIIVEWEPFLRLEDAVSRLVRLLRTLKLT